MTLCVIQTRFCKEKLDVSHPQNAPERKKYVWVLQPLFVIGLNQAAIEKTWTGYTQHKITWLLVTPVAWISSGLPIINNIGYAKVIIALKLSIICQ